MPVYNAMPFLPEAVESILNQTEQRFILYALDDGSTDDSAKYLNSLKNEKVCYVRLDHSGLVRTLNAGIELVDTPFIARMDADDICDVQRFSKQLNYMIENPSCVCVGTSAWYLSENGKKKGWPVFMPKDHRTIVNSLATRRSALIHPTIFIRTDVLKRVNGYHETAWPAEDYDLFFRISKEGQLANLNELLYSIRLHSVSITSSGIHRNQKKYEEIRQKNLNRKKTHLSSVTERIDTYAVYHYRKGITKYLNGTIFVAYFHLIISGILSPARFVLYARRRLNKWGKERK